MRCDAFRHDTSTYMHGRIVTDRNATHEKRIRAGRAFVYPTLSLDVATVDLIHRSQSASERTARALGLHWILAAFLIDFLRLDTLCHGCVRWNSPQSRSASQSRTDYGRVSLVPTYYLGRPGDPPTQEILRPPRIMGRSRVLYKSHLFRS